MAFRWDPSIPAERLSVPNMQRHRGSSKEFSKYCVIRVGDSTMRISRMVYGVEWDENY